MDWTTASVSAIVALVFVALIGAVWNGHNVSVAADERVATECVTRGGSSISIGGQRHCILMNNSTK